MADKEKKRGRWEYKNLNILSMKRGFKMKKTSFIAFEGLSFFKKYFFIKI